MSCYFCAIFVLYKIGPGTTSGYSLLYNYGSYQQQQTSQMQQQPRFAVQRPMNLNASQRMVDGYNSSSVENNQQLHNQYQGAAPQMQPRMFNQQHGSLLRPNNVINYGSYEQKNKNIKRYLLPVLQSFNFILFQTVIVIYVMTFLPSNIRLSADNAKFGFILDVRF
jgi:hypothetical protein